MCNISNDKMVEKKNTYMMNTYASYPIAMAKGEGVYLWDVEGKKYLDFVAGIAVNCLGYNDEKFIDAITEQLKKIHHCSNLYLTDPSLDLARILIENSDFDKVFFSNSGTESVEAGLKLCRKYGHVNKGEDCYEIITMKNSFHGRTLGSVTATGQLKYQEGFGPLLPGAKYAIYNDFQSLENMVSEKTCGIVLEVIQGEGGLNPVNKEYLQRVRELCDQKDIVLMFDEVQTGIGRTGRLFAYENYGIKPDIICLAKGLGGGIPIGATMAIGKVADVFKPGDHASTFGGNPMATAAGKHILTRILDDGILENVVEQGKYLKEKLEELKEKYPIIKDVRGYGLMQGIELEMEGSKLVNEAMGKGLLLVGAGPKVIRFVPPLIVKSQEIDEAMDILDEVLAMHD